MEIISSICFWNAEIGSAYKSRFFTGILRWAGFSVIFTISDAFWGRPIKIGEAFASFIPIGTIVFFVLFFAGSSIFEWYDHDKVIHSKEAWLNIPFFVGRNVVLFLFAAWLASLYIKNSVRPDIGLARKIGNYFQNKFADRFVKNFGDSEKEIEATYHRNKKLAPILAIVYALLTSFIAFDWMMSIDQEWFSTMFGVQFTVSSLIGAGALMLVITGIFRFKFQLTEYLSINRHHDLAKLTFAFCLLWSYMIFSQVHRNLVCQPTRRNSLFGFENALSRMELAFLDNFLYAIYYSFLRVDGSYSLSLYLVFSGSCLSDFMRTLA